MIGSPKVSVVIPTRNRRQKLRNCIRSILRGDYAPLEILVVDDASSYDVHSDLEDEFPSVQVYRNPVRRLLSYSRNLGARHAGGDYLFFLDDDNVIAPDAIRQLVSAFGDSEEVAVVSPVIYRYDSPDVVWTSYIVKGRFPGFYVLGNVAPSSITNTFSFHDAFMVRRTVFERSGEFDPVVFPVHFSELDLAYRLQKSGYKAVVNPAARVWHDTGRTHMHIDSVRSYYTLRNRIILLKRYASGRELRTYLVCVLPFLFVFYAVHHLSSSMDGRLRSTLNLLAGTVGGLAFRESPSVARRVTPPSKEREQPRAMRELGSLAELPIVSVIVPTKDSGETIARCLESLQLQTYPRIDTIVIDNRSTDETVSIAKTFRNVRVFEAGSERSSQVNFGVSKANGRYIYRVDADFIVEPGVVEEAVLKCELDGFRVVTIHNTSDPKISIWSAVRKLERDCYVDDTMNIAARFMSKEAFWRVGGFDETLIASEDYDLHNRLVRAGERIGRIKSKEVHIGEPKTLRDVVEKHLFYGTLIGDFIEKNPRTAYAQLSPIRRAYLRHWRDFLRNPKLTTGFVIYECVRYVSALVGYLSTKL